jgi:hypothetical protein
MVNCMNELYLASKDSLFQVPDDVEQNLSTSQLARLAEFLFIHGTEIGEIHIEN